MEIGMHACFHANSLHGTLKNEVIKKRALSQGAYNLFRYYGDGMKDEGNKGLV